MPWVIDGGCTTVSRDGRDGTCWAWQLIADDRRRQVLVGISGKGPAPGAEAPSERVSLARSTSGRSEVERVLGWPEPPAQIEIDSVSIRHFGCEAGPRLAH